jgi:hypothetical protein
MGSLKALQRLLDAIPRCCDCAKNVAVIINHDRWWMCEQCFIRMPCSDTPPALDLRGPVYGAMAVLSEEATRNVS